MRRWWNRLVALIPDAVVIRMRQVRHIGQDMLREWHDDRVSGLAAEVAFFWVLALFPALLVVAAALGFLDALVGDELAQRAEDEVLGFLRTVLTDEASGTVDAVRSLFAEGSPGVLSIGAAAAVWAASRGFAAMINALDVAYDVDERRGYVRLRALALLLAAGSGVVVAVVLAMLVLGPLLGTGHDVASALGLGGAFATFWDWLRWPIVVVAVLSWAATVFHIAPNHHSPWRWDLPGAALAALVWALGSLGLRLYLGIAATGNEVLGSLGGTLIVMLWLYVLAIGLVLGGELNGVLASRRTRRALNDRPAERALG